MPVEICQDLGNFSKIMTEIKQIYDTLKTEKSV
jgi:hypothetical protein